MSLAPDDVVVRFTAPRDVEVVAADPMPMQPGHLRVRTLYSGVSAGTELTAYRGSNPYLSKQWDAGSRLFTAGEQTLRYPISGWGYSEVGEVVEVAPDVAPGPAPGDLVYGIWGHRSEAVVSATAVSGGRLPDGIDPLHGIFARVGAVALNAVLAAGVNLGETVAVFGQGVIGLLATRMAVLSGAKVIAVDTVGPRLRMAARMGAEHGLSPVQAKVAEEVRALTADQGADVSIELSGSYRALHEAIRTTAVGGRVVAAGFYQGGAAGLDLGEEFHHNRISLVSSQIGGLPLALAGRWSPHRLQSAVMALVQDGRLDVSPLISHVVPARQAAEAYRLLDQDPTQALQVVLDFRSGDA